MSAVAASLTPRKAPVQARSAATIEALHIAAIQVLTREGLSRCTTTRIAERAGMSVGMAAAYFTYILTIAFCPQALGLPLWNGTIITWGILIGVGLIVLGFVMTAVYVRRANTRFDHLNQRLMEEVR